MHSLSLIKLQDFEVPRLEKAQCYLHCPHKFLKAFTGPKYYNLETSRSAKGDMDMSTATGGHILQTTMNTVILRFD